MNKIHYIQTEYRFDISGTVSGADSLNNLDQTYQQLYESAKKKFEKSNKPSTDVLFNQIRASHFGYLNNNYALYDPITGDSSAKTFSTPFNKPILLNHDSYTDPIGRITSASYVPFDVSMSQMKNLKVPKGVVVAHGYVSDKSAIAKILDGRYLTVSVGFSAKNVKCSICGNEPYSDDCNHYRGESYDGKTCYYIMGDLDYREVSYVTVPADQGKSHYAGVTNYELVCNSEDELKDKDYIIKNMVTTNEKELYQDSGISLFLAQSNPNNSPRGKGVYVFSSQDSAVESQILTSTWAKDLHIQTESGLYIPLNAASTTVSTDKTLASSQNDTDVEPTDKKHRKESMMDFDFSKVSCADALANVPGLKDHLDQLASKKHTDSVRVADEAKATIAARDEEIKNLKTDMEVLSESAKAIALDSIMTLMSQLEKPQYVSILAANKDNQDQLNDELKKFKDRFASRTLKSLEDTVADLRLELDAKKVVDITAATTTTDGQTGINSDPVGTGIQTTVEPSTSTQNNQDSSDATPTRKKVALFG